MTFVHLAMHNFITDVGFDFFSLVKNVSFSNLVRFAENLSRLGSGLILK